MSEHLYCNHSTIHTKVNDFTNVEVQYFSASYLFVCSNFHLYVPNLCLIPLVFILCVSGEQLQSELGIALGTNQWSSCYTHFVTDDSMCKDFGPTWTATDAWEKCGIGNLGKKVLCKRGR